MKNLFDSSSIECSKLVTTTYSTSFSWGIRLLAPSIRPAIYAIYGFVRYADEIVDTFHDYDQEILFKEFQDEYQKAIDRGISLNPILNAFQEVVHKYKLQDFVQDFMKRMEYDLHKKEYKTREDYENYIYGSADVVGLMCLRVFVNNDDEKYEALKAPAMKLGSAFQKVNFLRDLKEDTEELGRSYFPNVDMGNLTNKTKEDIVNDIEIDMHEAKKGIVRLPLEGRMGVYLAYCYYNRLLKKLAKADCEKIMNQRVRISNPRKLVVLTNAYIRFKLNFI